MKPILLSLLLALPALADEANDASKASAPGTALPEELRASITPEALTAAGFVSLFNGEDLSNWKKVGGTGDFEIKDGAIRGFGEKIKGNTFLRTKKEYSDFVYTFEFKFIDPSGNSGCMFRGFQQGENADGRVTGYQCEHDQKRTDGRAFTAGIYDEARRKWLFPHLKAKKSVKEAFSAQGRRLFKWDDWNHIVIKCEGNHLQTWLNGEKRSDFVDTDEEMTTLKGFFGLQVHGGKKADIMWRNLYVKEL